MAAGRSVHRGRKKKGKKGMMEEYEELMEQFVSEENIGDMYAYDEDAPPLGEGRFGRVVRATRRRDGRPAAIKIPIDADFDHPGPPELELLREVKVMTRVRATRHPNLLRMLSAHVCRSPGGENNTLYMATDLCSGGDLFERLADQDLLFTERLAAKAFRQLVLGMRSLHDIGLVHRDLKPENILLTSKEASASVVVGDFGLCSEPIPEGLGYFVGSLPYGAPESHTKPHVFTAASDVWAIGVILYTLLSGIPPFYVEEDELPEGSSTADADKLLVARIRAGAFVFWPEYWEEISGEAQDLVKRMLEVDPKKRITLQEALQHPWLARYHSQRRWSLEPSQGRLRAFNMRRKLRAAAMAAMWGARVSKLDRLRKVLAEKSDAGESKDEAGKDVTDGGDAEEGKEGDAGVAKGKPTGGGKFSEKLSSLDEDELRHILEEFKKQTSTGVRADGGASSPSSITSPATSPRGPARKMGLSGGSKTLSVKPSRLASTESVWTVSIRYEGFERAMQNLGFGELPLRRMFDVFDDDHSGTVDGREFVCGIAGLRGSSETTLRLIFRLMDSDGSGSIDRRELSQLVILLAGTRTKKKKGKEPTGPESPTATPAARGKHKTKSTPTTSSPPRSGTESEHSIERLFATLDSNLDGKVSFEEFKSGVDKNPHLREMFFGEDEGGTGEGGG